MGTHSSLTVPIPTKCNKVWSAICTFLLLVQGINEVVKIVMGIILLVTPKSKIQKLFGSKEDNISERIFFSKY